MSEHTEQAALFEWARRFQGQHPELRWLAAWPNGGLRAKRTAALLQEEGVQPGPPDVWLPIRRGNCPGLVIEMKFGKNTTTLAQREWLTHLAAQGWVTAVYYDWVGAALLVTEYLGLGGAVVAALRAGREEG